ncbi:MAG: M2 family metallopeptidase [Deltaproteobacteria bacterium]|nr:M2 family metallopeptidase [Deltaproteobacteria bacterium]
MRRLALISAPFVLAVACGGGGATGPCPAAPVAPPPAPVASAAPVAKAPTVDDAVRFVAEVDKELRRLWTWGSPASWVKQNFITDDTNALSADAEEANMAYLGKVIPEAARYRKIPGLPPDVLRQLELLEHATSLPAPDDAKKRADLAKLSVEMDSMYGAAKYCPKADTRLTKWVKKLVDPKAKEKCLTIDDLSKIIAEERDEAALREAWGGWHDAARPMRPMWERFVVLANEGARTIGYPDLGKLWNSGFDMTAEAFEQDVERLWSELKPLYDQLHCYARARLRGKYGKDVVKDHAPIPAHLLGNMWAQDWANAWDVLEPYKGQPSLDVTKVMKAKKWDERKVVATAEGFFVGLGLDPLPKTFWERSLFEKPKDREVVCHASAWDVIFSDDLRVKMCVQITEEDLLTAHHELGHVYYFHYYHQLPILLQEGANKGFHEGIGDTLALSVTPAYLKELGLIAKVPDSEKGEINVLMRMALQKISFMPFGKLVDQWRWQVFSGQTPPSKYVEAWWALRTKVQGVSPPAPRSEQDFDPGAKYHVPANTSYTRYFLAGVYQFQFHRALCAAAGHEGPLHTCSIAGSKAAGDKLRAMLQMGASKPWPEAMKALTGQDKADATAILDYFAPLQKWLKEQNAKEQCGW